MAAITTIKRRIGSVKNTRQITKAMQLVAAARMRKAQEAARQSRTYNDTARELLTRLSQVTNVNQYELFARRTVKGRLLIVITSDSGLAGAYNSNALKAYIGELKKDKADGVSSYTITVGQKAAHFVAKLSHTEVVGVYRKLPESIDVAYLQPIMQTAVDLFTSGKVDAVDVIYTHFYNSIRQEPELLHLLPAGFTQTEVGKDLQQAEFEPSTQVVLQVAARRLLDAQLLQSVLESVASEQSMRMMAMKNATDNATDLVDDLTLAFNNARQASITQELAEITGGAEAMK
ncbi:MAG TPA: ATP synthase F1 subunit gamma [Candidatus Saccharimonadales bacterium]|nr:ATP synthase F1 subunit gamma [Candidatus Saccharimonadales bacterium]